MSVKLYQCTIKTLQEIDHKSGGELSSDVLKCPQFRALAVRCSQMSLNVFKSEGWQSAEGKTQIFPLLTRYKRETSLNLIYSQVQSMFCVARELL